MDEIALRIFDLLPQYIGITNSELRCLYANKAYADLLGRSAESMIGMHICDLWGNDVFEEVKPFLSRALAGETVSFSKRVRISRGERRFGKVDLLPTPDGGYAVVMHDLDAVERHIQDRERLIHELDHRVNNILQILQSVLALELQSAEARTVAVLDAIKARVDALALSYELLSGTAPDGGWPVAIVLERVVYAMGPGVQASCEANPKLRIPNHFIETFVFIATEIARWASADGKTSRIEARLIPDGMELSAENSEDGDLTTKAGAAGIALVESFARRYGGGPLRGGKRLTIIFPTEKLVAPVSGD